MIRFADDMVAVFERLDEAHRFMNVLKKRFDKFGLKLHPEKTKMVDYIHPWKSRRKPETFDFLGFTHYWGKTKKGGYAIKKKTSSKKMRIGLKKWQELGRGLRLPVNQKGERVFDEYVNNLVVIANESCWDFVSTLQREFFFNISLPKSAKQRKRVSGETKFVCVDGPEFDGHLVDFDNMINRLGSYKKQEACKKKSIHSPRWAANSKRTMWSDAPAKLQTCSKKTGSTRSSSQPEPGFPAS